MKKRKPFKAKMWAVLDQSDGEIVSVHDRRIDAACEAISWRDSKVLGGGPFAVIPVEVREIRRKR